MPKNNKEKLSVFISSTYSDLIEYREVVKSAILGLQYHANDMIHWAADERDPTSLSLDELQESDLVVLLIAHRYGTIPPGETISITEIEFDNAVEWGIPVIVFLINEEYEWHPSKFEHRKYERLLAFKEKVKHHCTVKYYKTPDSLAALVTQAIVNFDRKHRPWLDVPRDWIPPFEVSDSMSIEEKADIHITIGPAEDGLPIVLGISRSDDLDQPVSELVKVLGVIEDAGINTRLGLYLRELRIDAEAAWKSKGVYEIKSMDGIHAQYYVTHKTVSALFSSSLLGFLLPPPLLGEESSKPHRKIDTHKLLDATGDRPAGLSSTGGKNRFLAVALKDGKKLVVGKQLEDVPQYQAWRNFIHESLHGFKGCRYVLIGDSGVLNQGPLEKYKEQLTRNYEARMDDNGKANIHVLFEISRKAVSQVILQLANALYADYHLNGMIHGDIKPFNCLVASEGVSLIDSLDIPVGEVSSALSPIWAAPEQISLRPVVEATDIYPFGLLLVSLLGGQLAGEITTYQLPIDAASESSRGSRVSFLRNPVMFLNSNNSVVSHDGLYAWMELIERCLRYDASERYKSINEFSLELENLITKYPPQGAFTLNLARGEMQMVRLMDGTNKICRLLDDGGYGEAIYSQATSILVEEIPPIELEESIFPNESTGLCPSCKLQNEAGTAFCDNCGWDLRQTTSAVQSKEKARVSCPSCGHGNIAGTAFCENCGNAVNTTQPIKSTSRKTIRLSD